MIRFAFRFLALVALAVAVTTAVVDASRTVAASHLVLTPLRQNWKAFSPDTLEQAQAAVERHLWPAVWDPAAVFVLGLPGFVVFAVLALLLYALGRRPERRRRERAFDV